MSRRGQTSTQTSSQATSRTSRKNNLDKLIDKMFADYIGDSEITTAVGTGPYQVADELDEAITTIIQTDFDNYAEDQNLSHLLPRLTQKQAKYIAERVKRRALEYVEDLKQAIENYEPDYRDGLKYWQNSREEE